MNTKFQANRGSIYDPLYVAEVMRESSTRYNQIMSEKINILDASQSRSVRETHDLYLSDPEFAIDYINDAFERGDLAEILLALKNVTQALSEKK